MVVALTSGRGTYLIAFVAVGYLAGLPVLLWLRRDLKTREAMLAEVEALIDSRYDGWILRPLTASLVVARRR